MPKSANPKKPKRTFKDLFSSYKTYDPEEDGYGSKEEWKSAFSDRMGLKEARETLRDRSPRAILGVSVSASWAEITKAFKKRVMEVHPDRCKTTGLSPEEAHRLSKEVVAAYSILAEEFGK
ncbi:MAG: J domain-containing protein [Syntrophorhabdaceae bacterium]|nr:J domain-containing protein [Syntrophorhabdaceae bacterium]